MDSKEMNTLRNEAKSFKGDTALLWAGKMATVAHRIEFCNTSNISAYVKQLAFFANEYDKVIFSRLRDHV